MEWITWRRAPLVQPTTQPRRSWVKVNGKRRTYLLADERIELGYEHGRSANCQRMSTTASSQVLTSNHALPARRWCTASKDAGASRTPTSTSSTTRDPLAVHHEMDHQANTAKVQTPPQNRRDQLKTAETALAKPNARSATATPNNKRISPTHRTSQLNHHGAHRSRAT